MPLEAGGGHSEIATASWLYMGCNLRLTVNHSHLHELH